jgi:hypothetical protein
MSNLIIWLTPLQWAVVLLLTGLVTFPALRRRLRADPDNPQPHYKNVHADFTMLEEAGLIVRDGIRLSAPWDTVTAEMAL